MCSCVKGLFFPMIEPVSHTVRRKTIQWNIPTQFTILSSHIISACGCFNSIFPLQYNKKKSTYVLCFEQTCKPIASDQISHAIVGMFDLMSTENNWTTKPYFDSCMCPALTCSCSCLIFYTFWLFSTSIASSSGWKCLLMENMIWTKMYLCVVC